MGEPGVYIEQLPTVGQTVLAAPTSVTAFVGRTQAGATGSATTVGDFSDYVSKLGPASAAMPLSLAVRDYFDNGGQTAIVFSVGVAGTPLTKADWLKAVRGLSQGPSFNILALTPDVLGQDIPVSVIDAAAAQCATMGAMAILGPPAAWQSAFDTQNLALLSLNDLGPLPLSSQRSAAVYFPNLVVPDPQTAAPISVSPVGAMAGVWAATDALVGVWSPPAGVNHGLVGALDLTAHLTDADTQTVDGAGINALRIFPGYGLVLWGAHTLAVAAGGLDPYRYIQTRRTLLYIEQSLASSLGWTAAEPSNGTLWTSVTQVIAEFLQGLWSQGALMGATASAAYSVVCDASNNTAADMSAGIVNVEVLVALTAPAEFEVIQLQLVAATTAAS